MYEFWHDYVKPKYKEKAKICYMDTDNFIIYIKTENIYTDCMFLSCHVCGFEFRCSHLH